MLYLLFALLDRWLVSAPDAARVGWLKGVVYAHRGLHGAGVPENSPKAFALAVDQGLGIECDVQRSSDGQAMVFHDWELDRLTAQTGALLDLGSTQLGQIVLTGGADTIPTLRQTLDLVAGRVPLLIEIKSRADVRPAPLCLAVRRVLEGYRGPVAVMSFDPRVPAWFHRYSPRTVHGLVVSEEGRRTLWARTRRHLALWRGKPQFVAYDVRDLPSPFARSLRRRGFPVLAWTVRSAELRERADLHADAPIAEAAGFGHASGQ